MFEIREHPAGLEPLANLGVEGALALVFQVVDREAGDDRVEGAEVGQGRGHVVPEELDPLVAREALSRGREHRLREVEADPNARRPVNAEQGEQAPVPRPQVEDAPRRGRHMVEEDSLALGSVREGVRA